MGLIQTQPTYNGIYIGADIGIADIVDKHTNSLAINETFHLGGIGIIGGGLIGYDYSIADQFKVGMEAFMNANALNTSFVHLDSGDAYRAHQTYNWGVRILPGYEMAHGVVGHMIFGYSNAHFKLTDSAHGYLNHSFNRNGFQPGLGVTTQVSDRISLRIDTIYTSYGTQQSTGLGSDRLSINNYYDALSTLEGNFTISYKFS